MLQACLIGSRVSPGRRLRRVAIAAALLLSSHASAQDAWFGLVLMHNGRYLDAVNCSDEVALAGQSTFAGGACQLWRFVPAGGGWARLQLKRNGKFLDAANCSERVALHGTSDFAGGACQLWRFVPAGNGWHRLQLKYDGRYLDALNCSDEVALHPGSDFAQGACQSWRLVRAPEAQAAPPPSAAASIRRPLFKSGRTPGGAPPAPQGAVTRVDDGCDSYARGAQRQFRAMQANAGCRKPVDGRWQDNYDAHYGWCLGATEAARQSEYSAREYWLDDCGATIRH